MSAAPLDIQCSADEFEEILSPACVRKRAHAVLARAQQNSGRGALHFNLRMDKVDACADYVLQLTKTNYPDLNIPFHSRWTHFNGGQVDRLAPFYASIAKFDSVEQARIKYDLVMVSVLLDAGAGNVWQYTESSGLKIGRSEGLAIASLHMFQAGLFSADPQQPLRVDADALLKLSVPDLECALQVSSDNPMIGLAGRTELLRKLGHSMKVKKEFFTDAAGAIRPGGLVDYLQAKTVAATQVLRAVLIGLSEMWPARLKVNGLNLGDTWLWPGQTPHFTHLQPFHKLSQWLSYSLLEPLMDLGIEVTGVEDLTGLPEYRNGGLLVDFGVLEVKDPQAYATVQTPGTEFILEWRALTVALLDLVGTRIQQKLNLSPQQLPLAKILQGGTWAAGRELAAKIRGGTPPFNIQSDGTVF